MCIEHKPSVQTSNDTEKILNNLKGSLYLFDLMFWEVRLYSIWYMSLKASLSIIRTTDLFFSFSIINYEINYFLTRKFCCNSVTRSWMAHAHLPLQAGEKRTLKVNPSNHQKSLIYNIALTMTKNIGNELFSHKK